MPTRKNCQLCTRKNLAVYIDGRIIGGPWADMCETCHKTFGVGLGTGKGQLYKWVENWTGKFTYHSGTIENYTGYIQVMGMVK